MLALQVQLGKTQVLGLFILLQKVEKIILMKISQHKGCRSSKFMECWCEFPNDKKSKLQMKHFRHRRVSNIHLKIKGKIVLRFWVVLLNPLTPVPAITCRDKPWPFSDSWHHQFWLKLPSSLLCCCRKKIITIKPRSEWSAEWSLRYAQKCSKSWVKNSVQNFLPLHVATPW